MQKILKRKQKLLKKLKKALVKSNSSSYILLSLGLILLVFGGVNYYRVRILSFDKVPEAVQVKVRDLDVPVEIIIPSLDIDLSIDPGQIKNGVWQISSTKATFLDTSAPPGTSGNTVIYGHNLKTVFANLPYLSIGQKIVVKTKSGKIYNYIASQKYFVGPNRVDLVSPTNNEELTIYTCWGVFDSQRVIIKALPQDSS